jgi:hypothetical protein
MKGGIHFTEPLPSNDRRDIHTDTQTDGRDLMKYSVKMGSGAMIYLYIPSFIENGTGIQKLMGRGDSQTRGHTAWRPHMPTSGK